MITYKHEDFINEAIDGVLNQNFNLGAIELLIADDCSPDRTEEIVRQYPKLKDNITIEYIKHSTNKGIIDNFFGTLKQAKGKYIAICEGDDYWTDSLKLQKQIDFLETNANVVIASHNVQIIGEEFNKRISRPYHDNKFSGFYGTQDLVNGFKLPTNSIVFRNGLYDFDKVPNWSMKIRSADKFLYLMISKFGSIYYDESIMAAYRKHPEGAVGSYDKWDLKKHIETHKNQIFFWKNFKKDFHPLYQKEIKSNISNEALQIVRRYSRKGFFLKPLLKYSVISLKNNREKWPEISSELNEVFKKYTSKKMYDCKIRFLIMGSKVKQRLIKLLG